MEGTKELTLEPMTTENLGHIIHQTLVNQRFVVLPKVGAFLLRKMPARIHPIHDRIEPPRDEVRFNKAIKEDDGLLVSKVSQLENIDHTEARSVVKQCVSKIEFELANRSEVNFGPLGVLSKNYEGKLIFTEAASSEQWPSQFGLASIKLQPIDVDRKVNIKQLAPSAKKLATEFPVKKAVAYAATLALLVSLGIIPLTNENNRNMASLSFASFVGKPKEVKYVPRNFQPMEVSASYVSSAPIADLNEPVTETLEEEVISPVEVRSNIYYVVAGSFDSKAEATALINDLSSRGFGGLYVGQFDGKHLVSYGTYSTLEDAKGMKASVKLGNPDAWVLADR